MGRLSLLLMTLAKDVSLAERVVLDTVNLILNIEATALVRIAYKDTKIYGISSVYYRNIFGKKNIFSNFVI